MLLRRFLFPLLIAAPALAVAQKPVAYKEPRILLLLDGSSSMLQNWGPGENRFQTAGRLIESLMDSMYRINPNVEFGLRMYGQQSPAQDNNCFDTKREVMFSKNNRDQMSLRLASLHPYGVSPIAYSLQRAAEEDLIEEHQYSYSIILLTDGGESCGGDLCAISKALEEKAIFFKPYIISMVDYEPLRQQYQCLGEYLTVSKQAQLKPTIQTILNAYRLALRTVSETPVEAPRSKPAPVAVTPTPKPAVVTPPAPAPVIRPAETRTAIAFLPLRRPENLFPVKGTPPPAPGRYAVPRLSLPAPIAEAPVVVPPPAKTDIALLPFRSPVTVPFPHIQPPTPPLARAIPALKRPVVEEEPFQVEPLPILGGRQRAPETTPPVWTARTRAIPVLKLPAPEEEPLQIAPLTFVIRRQRIHEMTPPVFNARPRTIPSLPLPKAIEEPKPTTVAAAPTPAPKPATPRPTKPTPPSKTEGPTPVEFKTRTERASASGILVYFTDGKGKYYKSTPQVEIRESGSGKLVKKFYRTIDARGEPDLQPLPPGTYNVVVAGRSNVMARNIPVGVDETLNLQMVVTNGSLRFVYNTNPRRPVAEFSASVVRRFADDHNIVRQKADEELPYEPGNYYLELNTLPVTRRNLDIDFGGATEIQIAEPGWVQFTNTRPIPVKVVLYHPLGEGFAAFMKMDITGDPEQQKIRLQPGTYEARWTTGSSAASPTIVRFLVKSNETTATELK